jgi:hypothetical protein
MNDQMNLSMMLSQKFIDAIDASIESGAEPSAVFSALQASLGYALAISDPENRKMAADTFAESIPETLVRAKSFAEEAAEEGKQVH